MRHAFATLALIGLLGLTAACRADDIQRMSLGLGGYSEAPVYFTAFQIGGIGHPLLPQIVAHGGDNFPRAFNAASLGAPQGDLIPVSAVWIDVATGQAWEADLTVDRTALTVEMGSAEVTAIFGPGAQLVIGSDPTPVDTNVVTIDVARICGTRRPDLDRDLSGSADGIPFLREALASANRDTATTPCIEEVVE